jgi:hypothetical protein
LEITLGYWSAAADHFQRAAELALAAGDTALAAFASLGPAALRVGDGDEAANIGDATRALALARQYAGPVSISNGLATLASALARVDPVQARALLSEAIQSLDRTGYDNATVLTHAVIVAARLGDWPLTLRLARRAIPMAHWQGTLPWLFAMSHISALALAEARPDTAARLQGAAHGIGRMLASNQGPSATAPTSAAPANAGYVAELRREATRRITAALGEQQLTRLRAEGEEMDLDHAVTYTIAEIDAVLADPAFGQS